MNVATVPISEILLAGPRGFCAGVERAIDIVELALSVCRPPVYVRREIVHNRHVVESLRAQGAVFVDGLAEGPDRIVVIDSVVEVDRLEVPNPEKIAYLTQTTLSVDDTRDVIEALRRKFPRIVGPSRDDICYATQNRQAAVKRLAGDVDVLLVIGAANSSNANRLVEVAKTAGTHAYLINDVSDIRPEWLTGATRIGITAGASTPEMLVAQVVAALRSREVSVREVHVVEEDVRFAIPQELERMAQERGMALPERTAMRQS